jgi:plastocyanin
MNKRGAAALLLTVGLMAACGGNDGGSAEAAEDGGASAVTATDNEFDPTSMTAAAGATLEVANDGEAPHNFSVEGEDIDVDIEPGSTQEVMLEGLDAGSYRVFCKFHEDAGMTATLEIEA